MTPLDVPSRRDALVRAGALALLALGAAPSGAHAQSPVPRVDPVFVTATRSPKPLTELFADVTLIEPDEIARSGAQTLTELLQRQPGIEIVQNGGPASTSGVFLRGTNRGQTLVLIDGVRVASSTVGATSLEAIPLDQVERVEILRGPASALYGSDAIGGVIQVFTRKGTKDFSANASAGYGTDATRSLAGGLSGSVGPLSASLQAGARRSDGFNAIVDPSNFSYDPDRDGYEYENVSGTLALTLAEGHAITAQYFRNRQDAQFDAGGGHDDRTVTRLESWQVGSANRIAPWWKSTLTIASGSDDSVSQTAFGDAPFSTVQRQYAWQNELALPAGTVTLGLERRDERVSGAEYAVSERVTDSVYGLYQVASGPHAVQANLRYDDASQYGGKATGNLAYAYALTPGWRVAASAGSAFKAPSFNDLYYPGFSNPDLAPETSRAAEASLTGAGANGGTRWQGRVVAWYNRVDQLIVFGCDAQFNCRPDNVDEARLYGVSVSGDAARGPFTARFSLDLQSPEDARTGHLLPRRSRVHGAASFAWRTGALAAGAEVVASGRRYDDPQNRIPLAGYAIVNLTLEYALGHGVTLFARGDNVLDRDYQLAYGYATGGAQVYAGVRWQR